MKDDCGTQLVIDLIRCRKTTEGHIKRRNGQKWTIPEQFNKMYEEVGEVVRAFYSCDKENMLKECTDVILATTTLLDMIEIDPQEFIDAFEKKLTLVEKRAGVKDW